MPHPLLEVCEHIPSCACPCRWASIIHWHTASKSYIWRIFRVEVACETKHFLSNHDERPCFVVNCFMFKHYAWNVQAMSLRHHAGARHRAIRFRVEQVLPSPQLPPRLLSPAPCFSCVKSQFSTRWHWSCWSTLHVATYCLSYFLEQQWAYSILWIPDKQLNHDYKLVMLALLAHTLLKPVGLFQAFWLKRAYAEVGHGQLHVRM